MKKIIILAFSVWSCQAVMGQSSCTAPVVPNAKPKNELAASYPTGSFIGYVCDSGYEFVDTHYALCEDGTWNLPVCKHVKSCLAPSVPNGQPANALKTLYGPGETLRFVCDSGYEFEGTRYAVCDDGSWRLPACKVLDAACAAPHVPNAKPENELAASYPAGSTVRFGCDGGYEIEGTRYALCEDGTWRLPVCKRRDETVCSAPRVPNARPAVDLTSFYATGRTVRFVCDSGYEFEGTDTAWCEDGIWRLPVCKVRNCGTQPLIENGDITELPDGNELKAQCKKLYKLTGPGTIRCVNGKWTELPVCKPPCKLDRTKILHTYHPDEYLQEGERKRFYCSNRYQIDISCTKGTTFYGECKYHWVST
ncbi:complement factor H-like isoform X2 [Ictalurus furcatus]|uniref:complement factor H-like isoform X2 n=1 Tax=Ictalurus furcatus TaxID=66913 RepID=UPI0023505E1B|nr:complement factor H-like isoform X2 [Ictalurus furcatus]